MKGASHLKVSRPPRAGGDWGVLVGPVVPDMHDPSRSRRLVISDNRRASLHGGQLDLELTLSGVPDRTWRDAFHMKGQTGSPIVGVTAPRPPRIVGDTIHWSIGKTNLVQAWWHLGRCVDRANAAAFARERPTAGRSDAAVERLPAKR